MNKKLAISLAIAVGFFSLSGLVGYTFYKQGLKQGQASKVQGSTSVQGQVASKPGGSADGLTVSASASVPPVAVQGNSIIPPSGTYQVAPGTYQVAPGTAGTVTIPPQIPNPLDAQGNVVRPTPEYIAWYNSSREGKAVSAVFDFLANGLSLKANPPKSMSDFVINPEYNNTFFEPFNNIYDFDNSVQWAATQLSGPGIKAQRVGSIVPVLTTDQETDMPGDKFITWIVRADAVYKVTNSSGGVTYKRLRVYGPIAIPKDGSDYKPGRRFKVEEGKDVNPSDPALSLFNLK